MFRHNLTLFTLYGFRVRINVSWIFLALLIVWSLAQGFFPMQYPGRGEALYWTLGLIGAFGLFFSLLFHEMSHSLIARWRGMKMGGITLFLFGGVAEMTDEPPTPRIEFEVAIAGPLASIFLAIVFHILGTAVAGALGMSVNEALSNPWLGVLGYLALINLILALFNLVPGYPLDGGRLLRAWLWHRRGDIVSATHTASRAGQGFGMLLIGLGVYSMISTASTGGLWWVLIGAFIIFIARQSYTQVQMRQSFSGHRVGDFIAGTAVSVSPDITLEAFLNDYAYRYHYSMYPVTEGDRLVGCMRVRDLKAIPREEWDTVRVGEAMQSCHMANTVRADEDAQAALQKMQSSESGQLIVTDSAGRLAGIVTLRDMLAHLAIQEELEHVS